MVVLSDFRLSCRRFRGILRFWFVKAEFVTDYGAAFAICAPNHFPPSMQDFPVKKSTVTHDASGGGSQGVAQLFTAEEEVAVGVGAPTRERSVAVDENRQSEARSEMAKIRLANEEKAARLARFTNEARIAEAARIRHVAQIRSEQVRKFHAAAFDRAAEESKIAAVAEIRVRTDEEARIYAENQARQQAEEEARSAQVAKLRADAEAEAAAEAATKAAEQAEQMPPPQNLTQRMVAAAAPLKALRKTYRKSKRSKGGSENAWFYTCEGERLGPVRFAQLRILAADFSLNPRLDMIWREGMEMWKPAGEIDGLFERRNVKGPKHVAVAVAVPAPRPQVRSAQSVMSKNAAWPGARRPSFFFASLLFPFIWHYSLKGTVPYLSEEFGQIMMGQILPFAPLVPVVLVIQLGLRRLINLGMSRWLILTVLMPIVNFWLGYRLLVCPAGYAYHKKLDAAGIILAILYGSTLMLAGLAVVGGIALLLDPAYCPPHWLPLRDVVRSVIQFFQ